MEETIKYSFFDQLSVSFLQPEAYKDLLKLKKKYIIGFVALVVGIALMIETLLSLLAWDISVGGMTNLMTNGIPKFTIENGVVDIERPINMELSRNMHLVVDSSVENYSVNDLSDYTEEFLLSKNNLVVKHGSMQQAIDLAGYKDIKMNNDTLVELIPYIKMSMTFSLVLLYGMKIIGFLITAAFFALLCRNSIRTTSGRCVTMKEAFCFAIYARAPFMLLDSINATTGYMINGTLVLVIGSFLTIRYIYKAQKSCLGIENPRIQ